MRDRLIACTPGTLVVAYGSQILCLDILRHTLTRLSNSTSETDAFVSGPKLGPHVEALAISSGSKMIAALYADKQLFLWETASGKLIGARSLPKGALALVFADDCAGQPAIIVNDKVGDVRAYPILQDLARESAFLLGHTASVGICLDIRDNILATGDRDEKVRISCFPCTTLIQTYLMGHTSFVSAVRLLSQNVAITASGDGTIAIWNTQSGKELQCVNIQQSLRDYSQTAGHSFTALSEHQSCQKEAARELPLCPLKEEDTIPVCLAISPNEAVIVVFTLGRRHLLVFDFPSLVLLLVLDLPALPIGAAFLNDRLLFVSMEAPYYLLAYQIQTGESTALILQENDRTALEVRLHCQQHQLRPKSTVDETMMSALKKEILEPRPKGRASVNPAARFGLDRRILKKPRTRVA